MMMKKLKWDKMIGGFEVITIDGFYNYDVYIKLVETVDQWNLDSKISIPHYLLIPNLDFKIVNNLKNVSTTWQVDPEHQKETFKYFIKGLLKDYDANIKKFDDLDDNVKKCFNIDENKIEFVFTTFSHSLGDAGAKNKARQDMNNIIRECVVRNG